MFLLNKYKLKFHVYLDDEDIFIVYIVNCFPSYSGKAENECDTDKNLGESVNETQFME